MTTPVRPRAISFTCYVSAVSLSLGAFALIASFGHGVTLGQWLPFGITCAVVGCLIVGAWGGDTLAREQWRCERRMLRAALNHEREQAKRYAALAQGRRPERVLTARESRLFEEITRDLREAS